MPSGRLRRESIGAGGTSLAPATAGGGRAIWIVLGLVVLGGLIVAIAALRGGRRAGVTPGAPGGELEAVEVGGAAAPDEPPTPPVAPVRLDPLGAADRLERALATERWFAKVTVHGGAVELRTEFCAQPRLRALITAAVDDLHGQGLIALRCIELHGAEVFSQPL